jgi:tRNA threonylcarbamoyladenosine modification (KEOPS) complex Cgi121 subunit
MEAEKTDSVLAARVRLVSREGDAELLMLRKRNPGLCIQLLTMARIPAKQAITMVGQQTLRAAKTDALLATKPEVDLLLRMSGTTQIAVAIQRSGYRAKGKKLLVAVGPRSGVERLRKELSGDPSYDVLEDGEMGAEDLAFVERAALLGTRS